MFVAKFIFLGAFAPFHSCQIFASLCIQGASNLAAFVSGLDLFMFNDVRFINFSDVFAC